MNRVPGIRILAIIGLLASGATGGSSTAWAQTFAGQLPAWQSATPDSAASRFALSLSTASHNTGGENQLHIVGDRSLPPAYGPNGTYGPAGTLRVVGMTEPLQQPEPIAPGPVQGNEPASPPATTPLSPPGNYEAIDTSWKPIGAVTASTTAPAGDLPVNFAATRFAQAGQINAPINELHDWPILSYSWEASAVGHNPLYFEDANLERYGYSHGILQPLISGGRFFTSVVFLPYKIVAHPPTQVIYPLGYYRPGDRAPPVREIEPIKLTATAAEAAFVLGMIIILP